MFNLASRIFHSLLKLLLSDQFSIEIFHLCYSRKSFDGFLEMTSALSCAPWANEGRKVFEYPFSLPLLFWFEYILCRCDEDSELDVLFITPFSCKILLILRAFILSLGGIWGGISSVLLNFGKDFGLKIEWEWIH